MNEKETDERLQRALSITEIAVQDMAEAGCNSDQIAIGLAWHLRKQVKLAMGSDLAAAAWMADLTTI